MQSMVTPITTQHTKTKKRDDYKTVRIQVTAGHNYNGYYKGTHLVTIPHDFCKDLNLSKGDLCVWTITKTEPAALTLRKLMIGEDA